MGVVISGQVPSLALSAMGQFLVLAKSDDSIYLAVQAALVVYLPDSIRVVLTHEVPSNIPPCELRAGVTTNQIVALRTRYSSRNIIPRTRYPTCNPRGCCRSLARPPGVQQTSIPERSPPMWLNEGGICEPCRYRRAIYLLLQHHNVVFTQLQQVRRDGEAIVVGSTPGI